MCAEALVPEVIQDLTAQSVLPDGADDTAGKTEPGDVVSKVGRSASDLLPLGEDIPQGLANPDDHFFLIHNKLASGGVRSEVYSARIYRKRKSSSIRATLEAPPSLMASISRAGSVLRSTEVRSSVTVIHCPRVSMVPL